MRRAARVDLNQQEIVTALRKVGATVQSLAPVGGGVPDLLVGYRRQSYLLEVKDGAKKCGELTEHQEQWHREWRGMPVAVVCCVSSALAAIGFNIGVEGCDCKRKQVVRHAS